MAIAGAGRNHVTIITNLARIISAQLLERPCDTFTTDMRVSIKSQELYAYPDVVVICGEPQFERIGSDTLLNPTLIIEVLSPSTEKYDRGEKFTYYRSIPSLQECLFISQDKILIEHYRREGDHWILTETNDPTIILELPSIGCQMPVMEAYRKVVFPPAIRVIESTSDSTE